MKNQFSLAELGVFYEDVVGYNIVDDDQAITHDELTKMMREYDDECEAHKHGRPFEKKGVY